MSRRPRDRAAEHAAITAAATRLLAGTPLRSAPGKLTVSELITETGLRRDVVYDHPGPVADYKARVKAQHSTPSATQHLADQNTALKEQLDTAKATLAAERATAAALRKLAAELSLELHQAHQQLTASAAVTRLPTRGSTIRPCS
jgi:hypothetical protein